MRQVAIITVLLLLTVGWAAWSLRAASAGRELGQPPVSASPATVAAIRSNPSAFTGQTVALTGFMTRRCLTAGCWFYLNDGTGELRVDAKPGNFTVVGLPMGGRLTVYGSVVQEAGEDPQLAAVGLRR